MEDDYLKWKMNFKYSKLNNSATTDWTFLIVKLRETKRNELQFKREYLMEDELKF